MDRTGRRLRHSQALSLEASQGPEVGGDGGSVSLLDSDGHSPREVGRKGWEGEHAAFKQFHS